MPSSEDYRSPVIPGQPGKTWLEINGQVYGARPDETGPIGGGPGYTRPIIHGDFYVDDRKSLLNALGRAKAGQVVYVNPQAELDLTPFVRANKLVLELPAGVTLAGNRGENGAPGGLIYSEEFATQPMLRAAGANVRITGLRLRGPDPKRQLEYHRHVYYEGGGGNPAFYHFPTSDGIQTGHAGLEVDNCELSGWSHAAIFLTGGSNHRIHHNLIHHNQRMGLGYGVSLTNSAEALIEFNLFDHNKHSIAGSGMPGSGYEARHNVVYAGNDAARDFAGQSHLFDMHGGEDRLDETSIAGDWLKIHHNLFASAAVTAINIRGVPQRRAEIQRNWFFSSNPGTDVVDSDGNTDVLDNAYGPSPESARVR